MSRLVPTPTVTFRAVSRCVAALAAVGLAREVWFHTVAEPLGQLPAALREPLSDARYLRLRALLPPGGVVGYVSDEQCDVRPGGALAHEVGTKLYQQALYALAPLVLRYDDASTPLVMANLADPAKLPALLSKRNLELVAEAGPGVALLRPKAH